MARLEYDEEASERFHMDVIHELDDEPVPVSRWVESMRRLNGINDPLARRILALHRDCGSGNGPCDQWDEPVPIAERRFWGCETTEVIAAHFQVEFPRPPERSCSVFVFVRRSSGPSPVSRTQRGRGPR